MLSFMYFALAVAGLVIAGAFVVLVRGLLREAGKAGRAAEDISALARAANEEVLPVARNASSTLEDMQRIMARVDGVASLAERLLDSAQIASTVSTAAKSSAAGLISVYEGVKQGIKTLRKS